MTSSDEESIDPWGDEPTWEQEDIEDDENDGNDHGGRTPIPTSRFAHAYAAQHTIILIDTNPSMFKPCIRFYDGDSEDEDEDEDEGVRTATTPLSISSQKYLATPMDAALMAAEKLLHYKVHTVATTKTNKRDGVGVMLYGTPVCDNINNDCGSNSNPNSNRSNPIQINENDDHTESRHNGDVDSGDDDDDETTMMERPHANATLKILVELSPPGVNQIKTLRSYLPSEYFNEKKRRDGDISAMTNNQNNETYFCPRQRDLQMELFGADNTQIIKQEERGVGVGVETQTVTDVHAVEDTVKEQQIEISFDSRSNFDESEGDKLEFCSLRPALYEAHRAFTHAKCVKKVSESAEKTDAKIIWIFTNQENPVFNKQIRSPSTLTEREKEERELLITTAKDIIDNGQIIHLWPLPNQTRDNFDRCVFYNEIIQEDDDDDIRYDEIVRFNSGSSVSSVDLESLLEEIVRRWKNIRKLQTIPMLLPDWKILEHSIGGNGGQHDHDKNTGDEDAAVMKDGSRDNLVPTYPGIMLDLYQTIRISRKPTAVTIDTRTSKRTNKITQIYSKETGEIISKERIRYYTDFGGETVHMSREEVSEIKKRSNGNPDLASLLLLGFKPLPATSRAISELAFVDRAMFAYPNNYHVKGSKTAFATLHASMIKKNVMGVGELLLRVTAVSRLVAIIPQKADGGREQFSSKSSPPGFLLIPLAFEDDIRSLPRKHDIVPDKNMVQAAKELIDNQDIGHNIIIGESFENPALKTFWNYIESVALDTPLEDESSDDEDTKMNVEEILDVVGDKISAFKATIPESDFESKVSTKRKAEVEYVPDETGIDWLREYEMNSFDELRVQELKAYLRSYGEKISGRKGELIERIKRHIRGRIGTER